MMSKRPWITWHACIAELAVYFNQRRRWRLFSARTIHRILSLALLSKASANLD